jgi:hypothetical protein
LIVLALSNFFGERVLLYGIIEIYMEKQQLLKKIDLSWQDFKASVEGIPDAQFLEPGVTGSWSVKDILAHVTTWEEETLKHLPTILAGNQPPRYADLFGGLDAFNAHMTEIKKGLTCADVLSQLDETHQRLIAYIEIAPDEQIATETRFRRRLRLDTYSHYPMHASAIRQWRAKHNI